MSRARKICLLHFENAADVGMNFGEHVARFSPPEFLTDKRYFPKDILCRPKGSPTVDVETETERRKKHNVELVVIGAILEAETRSSNFRPGGIWVRGQSPGHRI